jgi:hypothetical protein
VVFGQRFAREAQRLCLYFYVTATETLDYFFASAPRQTDANRSVGKRVRQLADSGERLRTVNRERLQLCVVRSAHAPGNRATLEPGVGIRASPELHSRCPRPAPHPRTA